MSAAGSPMITSPRVMPDEGLPVKREQMAASSQPTAARMPIVSYSYSTTNARGGDCYSLNANSRCNSDVILITNCSRAGLRDASVPRSPAGCYDWGRNAERSGAAALLRRHPGPPPKHPNGKEFEMASIIRWLFLAQLTSDLQLETVMFVDCDVYVYSDFAALFASHPVMHQAELAITGRNGAISVWRLEAIVSFAAFLIRLVELCSLETLSKRWSVDMAIIAQWQGYATDLHGLESTPALTIPSCNGSFHVRLPRLRTINLDQLIGGEGWRLPQKRPVPPEWRFGAGTVGFACPPPPKGCTAVLRSVSPPVNCSSWYDLRGFHARLAPMNHSTKGPQLVKEMYRLEPARGQAVCTPFVRDVCGALAPFHAVHYTGRFKQYMAIGGLAGGSSCTCVRSWTRWDTPHNRLCTTMVSHPSKRPARANTNAGSSRPAHGRVRGDRMRFASVARGWAARLYESWRVLERLG